jgi:hypothetical protein
MNRTRTALVAAVGLVTAACGTAAGVEEADPVTTTTEVRDTTTTTAAEETTTTTEAESDEATSDLPFDEVFEDDSNGWGPVSTPEVEVALQDSALVMAYESHPNYFVEYFPDVLLDDAVRGDLGRVFAEATVQFEAPGAAVLACNVDPDLAAPSPGGYFFVANGAGHVQISKREPDGQITKLASTSPADDPFDEASAVFTVGESIDLGMECLTSEDGVELHLFVDGEPVLDATDTEDVWDAGLVEVIGGVTSTVVERDGFSPFVITWDNLYVEAE